MAVCPQTQRLDRLGGVLSRAGLAARMKCPAGPAWQEIQL